MKNVYQKTNTPRDYWQKRATKIVTKTLVSTLGLKGIKQRAYNLITVIARGHIMRLELERQCID